MMQLNFPIPVTEGYVQANGLDIWYVEAGQGIPLLLLHAGTHSNGPIWVDTEMGWGAHLGLFAQHFRVIAPDTRGHGRTLNPSGIQSYPAYVEDVLAFAQALHLDKPLLCGFSDGGHIASLVGILAPDVPRAIVNLAGYDLFSPDPQHSSRLGMREWLGGDANATISDPEFLTSDRFDPAFMQKRIDDFEPTQGAGYMTRYFANCFKMWTTPWEYTFDDFPKITAPTLLLVGDRDEFCSVEEGVSAFRRLQHGEFGVVPGIGHGITPLVCTVALDFLLRHCE